MKNANLARIQARRLRALGALLGAPVAPRSAPRPSVREVSASYAPASDRKPR